MEHKSFWISVSSFFKQVCKRRIAELYVVFFCCCCYCYDWVCVSGLDHTSIPLPVSLLFLCYIFSCWKSFLLVFRLFSEILALSVVVILVSPWEKVSSGSSYSAKLISSHFAFFFFPFSLPYVLGYIFHSVYFPLYFLWFLPLPISGIILLLYLP